ncbi:hypothetical protein ADICYQ_5992 [Cyclobacterium qasimii M12-11B]|uniref:Uncharacterized protein n=1 Tax=Cyclobacterium qasimii M12-11B TaxID=641524 RepID=S7WLG9_9BACT|nr:hypothetical protein ADICYQ_5992 [Cyclobacterium qasimii M12-11B]
MFFQLFCPKSKNKKLKTHKKIAKRKKFTLKHSISEKK